VLDQLLGDAILDLAALADATNYDSVSAAVKA
jgi:hypothetical protein